MYDSPLSILVGCTWLYYIGVHHPQNKIPPNIMQDHTGVILLL